MDYFCASCNWIIDAAGLKFIGTLIRLSRELNCKMRPQRIATFSDTEYEVMKITVYSASEDGLEKFITDAKRETPFTQWSLNSQKCQLEGVDESEEEIQPLFFNNFLDGLAHSARKNEFLKKRRS
jgi:hypothetical protein